MKPIPKPLTAPWAISEEGMQLVLAVYSRGEFFAERKAQALAARNGERLDNTRSVRMRDGVAIIPIEGPLFRHASFFDDISGATSYTTIRKDLQAALENDEVKAILLDVNSPGGECDGCNELAEAIRAAGDAKPLWAYVGGYGCSAAYWLTAAARRVVCAETAFVGSIGTRITIVDYSKFDEKLGIREVEIISSQSPDKRSTPVDGELVERLRERCNELTDIFVAAVARHRDVPVAKVLTDFGRGDVVIGGKAVEAGMVDALGNFEGTLAELAASVALPTPGPALQWAGKENRMSVKAGTAAPAPAASSTAPTAKEYTDEECEECMEEQEASARALGLDAKATGAQIVERATALVQFEQHVLTSTGTASMAEARGKIGAVCADAAALPGVRAELAKEKAGMVQRDLRAVLETGLDKQRLSLGAIQKSLPLVLRGEQKTSWTAAMGALEKVTRESVLNAACSVAITADDLAAIGEYAKSAAPIAAETVEEPPRDPATESAELDATEQEVKKLADKARATLDRGKAAAAKK